MASAQSLATDSFASLGDIVENVDQLRVPLSASVRSKRQGEFPYYGASGVLDHIDDFIFEGRHVLVGEDGTVQEADGTALLQLVDGKFWVNNHAHVLRGATDRDTQFVYYALKTIQIRPYLSGSVQAKLTQANLNRILIPFPSPSEREQVVGLLGALDDKIEVNRRMGETLEEIARALFQSWFVDFDPVRGTAIVPEEIRRLFPDRLADSTIGPVPAGWEARPAGEVFEVVGGSTPSTQEPAYWGGAIPFATPKDMSLLSSPILTATQRGITREGAAAIGSGVLPPRTVLMSSRAPIGYLALTAVPVAVNQGIIAVLPTSKLPPLFALNWLGANMRLIEASANGSTFQEISKRSFRELPLALPNPEAVDAFESFAEPLYGLISSLSVESKTLADLRDTLLPKLLSGELKIAVPTGSAFSDGL